MKLTMVQVCEVKKFQKGAQKSTESWLSTMIFYQNVSKNFIQIMGFKLPENSRTFDNYPESWHHTDLDEN